MDNKTASEAYTRLQLDHKLFFVDNGCSLVVEEHSPAQGCLVCRLWILLSTRLRRCLEDEIFHMNHNEILGSWSGSFPTTPKILLPKSSYYHTIAAASPLFHGKTFWHKYFEWVGRTLPSARAACLRTFAAKTSNVQNFFKLLQEWDIVERIRKTKKKLGVTALLLQLGSIENDQIWSFLRYWVSLRHGGENTFRVSKTKKFWTFLVKDECSCNYKPVLDAVQRWNRPLEAFEGQAWPIIRTRRSGKPWFGRCSNVQNFFYFWYDVEFWKGNLIIKKKIGGHRANKREKDVQIQFRIPCVTPNVTDLPQLSHNMYSRWRGLPIAADCERVFLSILHVHGSNMNGIEVPCRVWKLDVGFWATRPGNTTILRLKK